MSHTSTPPVARVEPVQDTRFGVSMLDAYRWMEHEGAELHDWLAGQGTHAASVLTALPDREALLARVTELTAGPATSTAFCLAADRTFFLRRTAQADVPALVVRDGSGDRVLLDPATLPGAEHSHIDWHVPSPDARHVACGISQGGSEQSILHIIDADTGAMLPERISGMFHGAVSWLPDCSSLVYHRYPGPAPGAPEHERRDDSQTRLHRLGTSPGDDVLILARGLHPTVRIAKRDRPFVVVPGGSDWMVAIISHSALIGSLRELLTDCSIYVAPRDALADPTSCPWRYVAGPADGVTAFEVYGDMLYLVSHKDAPRSRVLRVPLDRPDLADAVVVVPGGERAIVGVRVVGGELLVRELDAGISRMRRVPLANGSTASGRDGQTRSTADGEQSATDGKKSPADGEWEPGQPVEVPLPVAGSIEEWTVHPDGGQALLVLESLTDAPQVYRFDAADHTVRSTGWLPPTPAGFRDLETDDLRVRARDGTVVPLWVVHRKDLVRNGDNPTLLTGYGSYGFVPRGLFKPELLAWFERGGVYAVAGLRGGGEFGRQWHEAGRKANKEHTITDFIDCAERLVSSGYTRSTRLAGDGISAGGIPTGGALVRRPELWAAMVMRVPATNLTRQEFSENGPINTPEFGSVTTAEGLRDLLIVDSYLRVEDGTSYPAVLLSAGLNDPRVRAWQPGKMAARLQAATASTRPVLLRVDPHAGHGHGSTKAQRDALTADVFAFLLHHLSDDGHPS